MELCRSGHQDVRKHQDGAGGWVLHYGILPGRCAVGLRDAHADRIAAEGAVHRLPVDVARAVQRSSRARGRDL